MAFFVPFMNNPIERPASTLGAFRYTSSKIIRNLPEPQWGSVPPPETGLYRRRPVWPAIFLSRSFDSGLRTMDLLTVNAYKRGNYQPRSANSAPFPETFPNSFNL